jgi:hypothetical protein
MAEHHILKLSGEAKKTFVWAFNRKGEGRRTGWGAP